MPTSEIYLGRHSKAGEQHDTTRRDEIDSHLMSAWRRVVPDEVLGHMEKVFLPVQYPLEDPLAVSRVAPLSSAREIFDGDMSLLCMEFYQGRADRFS